MQIIKLDATHSTNLYLKKLSVEKQLEDFTIVVTENQFEGRGQRGAVWQSEKGKNLTFSIFKRIGDLAIRHQFAIGMCTALAVYNCLDEYGVPDLRVKWPNDIMSGQKKICGILIENTFASGIIKSAIIGIGLNANQTNFVGMEKASSLKLVCHTRHGSRRMGSCLLALLLNSTLPVCANFRFPFNLGFHAGLYCSKNPRLFIFGLSPNRCFLSLQEEIRFPSSFVLCRNPRRRRRRVIIPASTPCTTSLLFLEQTKEGGGRRRGKPAAAASSVWTPRNKL